MSSPQMTRMLGGLLVFAGVADFTDFAVFTLFAVFAMSLLLLVRNWVPRILPPPSAGRDRRGLRSLRTISHRLWSCIVEPVKDELD